MMNTEHNSDKSEKALRIGDVMRCFDIKENELKDSINYDIKYFGGDNVSKLTERLNAIEDLRDLVNRVAKNSA